MLGAIALVTTGCFAIAFAIAAILLRRSTGWMTDYGREFVPCNRCTAGTQWYDWRHGWGTIPMSVRIYKHDSAAEEYGPPSANVRTCTCCNGMAGHWVDGKQSRRAQLCRNR